MQRNQLVLKSLFFINQNSTVLSSDIKTKHYIVISIWLHSPCLYRRLFIVERMASKLFGQRQSFSLCYNSYLIDVHVYDPSSKMFYSQTCVHFLLLFHIVSLLNFIISSNQCKNTIVILFINAHAQTLQDLLSVSRQGFVVDAEFYIYMYMYII